VAVIPGNLVSRDETLEGFAAASDWTVGNGTAADDAVNFRSGTQGVKFTTTAGADLFATKTVALDMSARHTRSRLLVYIHNEMTDFTRVGVICSNNSTFTNYFSASWTATNLVQGWNQLACGEADWSETGTPSWDSSIVRLRVIVHPENSAELAVTFDSFRFVEATGAVMFEFDDAYESAYTNGVVYITGLGYGCNIAIASDTVGSPTYITAAHLQTAYANGCDITNHSKSHQSFVGQTEAEAAAELSACTDYIEGTLACPRGARFASYPGGSYDDATLAAMATAGMLLGKFGGSTDIAVPVGEKYQMPEHSLTDSVTLAAAKVLVDNAKARGTVAVLKTHGLLATASGMDWAIADWQALVDYVIAEEVRIITLSEFFLYAGLVVPSRRKWHIPLLRRSIYPDRRMFENKP
jgi:peptidoglycan/xylan/chitin deacetylase (PgdA/CDA1 family)